MALVDNGLEILSEAECRELLRAAPIGRVAVTVGALPAVFPVNHGVVDGDIVFLTGEGTKLRAALDRTVVAFEVDDYDVDGEQGWSVLAVGMASEVTDPAEIQRVHHLDLRPLAADACTHVVRIRPEFLSGRRARRTA